MSYLLADPSVLLPMVIVLFALDEHGRRRFKSYFVAAGRCWTTVPPDKHINLVVLPHREANAGNC